MVRRVLPILLVLLCWRSAWAQLSDEQKTDRARIHLKAAIAYYDDGRNEHAAREMNAAYELRPLPDLQYNLAQCYERLNRLADAAQAYETYLKGKPNAADRKNVQARIDNLRERTRAEAAGQVAPSPAPTAEKVVFKTIVVYREKAPPPGRAARWAAYGLGVLALAGVATGIAYAVLAKQAADTVTNGGDLVTTPVFGDKARDAQDSGHTYPIISGVSFGIAGAAAIGSVALYLAGNKIDKDAARREQQQSSRGVNLAIAPTLGGLVVAGTF
jgi:tetratricopeptide (TPR) repeat protein